MPTMNEIRTEWKAIRSALGNIICYLDGKADQFGEAEEAWQKGYDAGHRDGYKNGWSDCIDCEGKLPKEKTNADKFLEVFPGVESIDKLVTVLKTDIGNGIVQSDWWSEPYREGRHMSERQEKKKRYNLRLQYIAEFQKWLDREPPMWKFWAWRKWKAERPVWVEVDNG